MAAAVTATGKTMLILDFDSTVIDCNSDTWVPEKLSPAVRAKMTELRKTKMNDTTYNWTDLMDEVMQLLHAEGFTQDDVAKALQTAPLEPPMAEALREAQKSCQAIWICSDANTFFIETILQAHGLRDVITGVITNPCEWTDQGLRVTRLVDRTTTHGCDRCAHTPNMCKGKIVKDLVANAGGGVPRTVVYVGDGGNDFCASLALRPGDVVLPRTGFTLARMVDEDSKTDKLLKARAMCWATYDQLNHNIREALSGQ